MADFRRPAALALLAAGLLLPGLLIGPSLDAAVFVHVATQVRDGHALYVDAWDHKPPGVFLIFAAAQSLLPFLDSWLTVWLISVVVTAGSGMAVAVILDRIGAGSTSAWLAGGATVVVMGQYLTALGGGLTEPIASLPLAVALMVAIRPRNALRNLLIGALLSVTMLTSVPVVAGAVVVAAVAILASPRKLAGAALIGIGALVPLTAVAGWLAVAGALGPAIDAVVVYAAAYRQANQGTGLLLSGPVASWTVLALLFVIAPAMLGVTPALRVGGSRRLLVIASLAWIGLSVGLFVYQGRFFAHYAIPLAIPLGLLAGIGLDRLAGRARRRPGSMARRALYLPIGLGVVVSMTASVVGGEMEWSPLARQHERVNRVAATIQDLTEPDDTIWVWGADPQLYLAANRDSATRYGYLYPLVTPGYATADMIHATVRDLEADSPTLIIDAGSDAPGAPGFQALLIPRPLATDGRDLDLLDPLREFIADNYVEHSVVEGWVVYRPGD